jgi:hypothetical protein
MTQSGKYLHRLICREPLLGRCSDNNLGKEHCNKLPAEFIQQEALALPLALAGEIEAYQCPGAKVDGAKAVV